MRYSAVVALAGVAAVQAASSGSSASGSASSSWSKPSSWSKTGSASASGSGSWSKAASHKSSSTAASSSSAGQTSAATTVSPPATSTASEGYGTWVTEWETVVETVYVCPTLSSTWTFPSTWTASTETVVVVPSTSTASTPYYPTSSASSGSGKPPGTSVSGTVSKSTGVSSTISKSTGVSTPSSCPTTLTSGSYEYPHLIVPVSSAQPNTALGTSYNGTITPTVSSIFDFDIPSSDSGKTCSLVFLFPELSQLETSSYAFNGQGGIKIQPLAGPATEGTTYANQPAASGAATTISPLTAGSSYSVFTGPCAAGQRIAYEFSSVGGLDLNFFEDYNPSPLGAFITVC